MLDESTLYNLVALPTDPVFAAKLTDFAWGKYRLTARDYLLGPQALPHMTLCFFNAQNTDHALDIASKAPSLPNALNHVLVNDVYCKLHEDKNGVFCSTGLLVEKTPLLCEYQETLYHSINHSGGKARTPYGDPYWPHFTCVFTPTAEPILMQNVKWAMQPVPVRLALGLSDPVGQFLHEITLKP
jgi:hypothetical protein